MPTIKVTRLRDEWVEQLFEEHESLTEIANLMGITKSTASRWLSGKTEASGRCIAAILLTFPVSFDEAFVVAEEQAERRRVRTYLKPKSINAA